MKLRRCFHQLVSIFDIPRSEPTPPKPKSPLRLQFETEWSEAVNSAGRALNLAALGIVSGVCLLLQGLLCSEQKIHAALAAKLAKAEDDRKNRQRIDRLNAFLANDILVRPMSSGWEKQRQWEKQC